MIYQPTAVSPDFYEEARKVCPEAFNNTSHARLFDHLIFSQFKDEDTGYTVTPERLLADMEDLGRTLEGKSRNYGRAHIFPQEFQEATGLELAHSPYHYTTGKAASYKIVNLPDDFTKRISDLRNCLPAEDEQGVYFETGRPFSQRERKAAIKKFKNGKNAYMAGHHWDSDVNFLNDSSYHSNFLNRDFERRMEEAEAAARRLGGKKEAQNLMVLGKLVTFEPWYTADSNYHRMYAHGSSLQNLSSSVRKVILAPSVNYDLTAAQLAIMARHWGVVEVLNLFEETDGDVWPAICISLGLHPEQKHQVKPLIYSTAFGMSHENLAFKFGQILGDFPADSKKAVLPDTEATSAKLSSLFFRLEQSRYLGPLLAARSAALKRLSEDKYAINPDGSPVDQWEFSGSWKNGAKGRSMMAYEMQTREKWIMEPVLQVAREEKKHMNVSLWLHDGVYIHYLKPGTKWAKAVEKELIQRVNERAASGGYPTRLAIA